MMFNCVLVLALAAIGGSASFVAPGYVSNGFNNVYGTRVSDVCRCVKSVVRPQIRTDITEVPTFQRFVRTEATPVIERIPYLVSRRMDGPSYVQGGTGVFSAGLGGVASARGFGGVNGAFGGAGVGVLSGVSTLNSGYVY